MVYLLLKPLGRLLGGRLSDATRRFLTRLRDWYSPEDIFTKRDGGLGYYLDRGITLELLPFVRPLAAATPITLALTDLVLVDGYLPPAGAPYSSSSAPPFWGL